MTARLGEIGCPALILVGERDPSTPPAMASVLADGIRDARLVVVPNVSHMSNLESPDAINEALRAFLSGT